MNDIAELVHRRLNGVIVPKASVVDVSMANDALVFAERELGLAVGHTRLLPMIESAAGVDDASAIVRCAHERCAAVMIGRHDLAHSLECAADSETLWHAYVHVLMAARAAGISPLASVHCNLRAHAAFAAECVQYANG